MNQLMTYRYNRGFSIIELLVSVSIGVFLIAGVFTVYLNGRSSQQVVDDQALMVDNARFALDLISSDIRQAGVYGRVREAFKVTTNNFAYGTATCVAAQWEQAVDFPVLAYEDNANNLLGSCAANYAGGDVLEVRYSLVNSVPTAQLRAGKIYLNSNTNEAQFFIGSTSPNLTNSADYEYVTNAYYIASFTDTPGDGIPSLRRLTLQANSVSDDLLLAGVQDMQVQIGIDSNADGTVDSYVNPGALNPTDVAQWSQAKTVQVWLVMRSLNTYSSLNTVISANIAGNTVTLPASGTSDGIRRMVVSTVADLRNR